MPEGYTLNFDPINVDLPLKEIRVNLMSIVCDEDFLTYHFRSALNALENDLSVDILIKRIPIREHSYLASLYPAEICTKGGARRNLYQVPEKLVADALTKQLKPASSSDKLSDKKVYRQSSYRATKDSNEGSLTDISRSGRPRSQSSKDCVSNDRSSSTSPLVGSVALRVSIDENIGRKRAISSPLKYSSIEQRVAIGKSIPIPTVVERSDEQVDNPDGEYPNDSSARSSILIRRSTLVCKDANVEDSDSAIILESSEMIEDIVKASIESTHEKEEKNEAVELPITPVSPDVYLFTKLAPLSSGELMKSLLVSNLSALMDRKAELTNPLAVLYSGFSGKMDQKALNIKMMLPFRENPEIPLFLAIKADATVDDVIGFCLLEYINEKIAPNIPLSMRQVKFWNIRIVEDDGEIDEDFPALDRSRKIQKYAFDQFALISTKSFDGTDDGVAAVINGKEDVPVKEDSMSPDMVSPSIPSVYLKVHLYSTLEVKQTTIMPMPVSLSMQEVFNRICNKRRYDQKDYVLKMADTKTDVPMEKTLQQLDVTEFCVLKRSSGGAGDIFVRPPDEADVKDEEEELVFSTEDYRTVYRQYIVSSSKLMGRQERVLILDGDHVHIQDGKAFLKGKTSITYNMKDILSCIQPKKSFATFRLTVKRFDGIKIHEFEAQTPHFAKEVSARFSYILERLREKGT